MALASRISDGGRTTTKKTSTVGSQFINPQPASTGAGTVKLPTGTGTVLKPRGTVAPVSPPPPTAGGSQRFSMPAPGPIGGGGGGGGMGDPGAMLAPAVAPPSEEDYLAGDSGFQTQQSALQAALQRFLADSDFQRGTYEKDYGKSLRDLGYDEGSKQWNWNDKLTASGRGNQAQLDDFGNRGMLQSSAYADAFNELQRMLGQQYESMSSGRQTFMTDMDNQVANFRGENTANSQAARAEALQRRAAQFGL